MELKQLSECPQHFECIGNWIYEEWWRTPDNSPEIVFEWLRQHLECDALSYTIVAIVDGEPVGSCCVIENDCALRPQYGPWVAAVYVKPEMRLRGVATGFLGRAVAVARDLKISALYIDCWAKTAPVYMKSGWEILERDVGEKDSVVMHQSIDCR
ncbi:MAG: GNAT family N-acetyltransferase [bacterium]|nr:GNAT family N-acetyltransferase [bacterium]